jgi:hypothetical protein
MYMYMYVYICMYVYMFMFIVLYMYVLESLLHSLIINYFCLTCHVLSNFLAERGCTGSSDVGDEHLGVVHGP